MTAIPEIPRIDRTPDDQKRAPRGTEPERLWRTVVGELLRDARADRGETLAETAQRAGVSPQYLSEMERGRKEPSSEMLAAVSGALELTLLDLTLGVAERIAAGTAAPVRAAAQPSRVFYALAA
ncbi:Helix-turn-helix domain-containing protein [Microbacterium azadirachtae]|uniref:Helix-turn-helix domain-containing protein n=1 Tax=Microbacterium azadirachtae TaxID=582680 RepID=A0A1I6GCP1_9MICO|nr:helix-turn-helix transcriptional regulator [Microbacterium azadirachtae]SFR39901.1 Helix-turn-helix domain-containing protein [Microbacterium azadirachtae]